MLRPYIWIYSHRDAPKFFSPLERTFAISRGFKPTAGRATREKFCNILTVSCRQVSRYIEGEAFANKNFGEVAKILARMLRPYTGRVC